MTFWIIKKIITAYLISTAAFLIIIIFNKASRRRTNIFLNRSNLILIFGLILNIIWVGSETINCYISEFKDTDMPSADALAGYRRRCFSIFIGTFLFAFLFHLLFFFKRYRTKISLTLVSIFLLTIPYNYERLIIYITGFYRDYIPSGWSILKRDITGEVLTVVFAALYFTICWRNKTEFKDGNLVTK